MDVPIHHLLRQLRDTGWGWQEIAVAFPELGLDPAADYDGIAAAARRYVTPAATAPEVSAFRPVAPPSAHRRRPAGIRWMSSTLAVGQ
jgi:hypothetical protein